MNERKQVTVPFDEAQALELCAGDQVLISGILYTARDAAHQRLDALLSRGEPLPVALRDGILYYVGPAPATPGVVGGPAGPTTSYRMDGFAPRLMRETGLRGMIGKGKRSPEVVDAIRSCRGVYFAAIGGAGALLAQTVKASETAAYPELGAEAIYRLTVQNFPAVVVIDCAGNNLYELGPEAYRASQSDGAAPSPHRE
ncbi:MAG: Fe-S-containing hydro-lyase [Oscillospiraceae bacterium]